MTESTPKQRIAAAVAAWPGVEAGEGERGEFAFRYRGRELGHLHGAASRTSPSLEKSESRSGARGEWVRIR